MFNDLQKDTLIEVFNVGMGAAGASLSEMVGDAVALSVPDISIMTKGEAADLLTQQSSTSVSGVSQSFSGPFGGLALLLFPVEKSLTLVHLLLQDTVHMEKMTEYEEEALCEIGNIILNSGLAGLADMFGSEIQSAIPKFTQGSCQEVLYNEASPEYQSEMVLFLHIDFRLDSQEIEGHVVFLLDVKSIKNLIGCIDSFIERAVA